MMLIYTECRNQHQARALADKLIKVRLAACVNWWPIKSLYQWQGKKHYHKEVAVLCKTKDKLVQPAQKYLLAIHPYQTPVIIAWRINKINQSAADWLRQELN